MKKKTHRPFLVSFSLSCFFILFLFLSSYVLADESNETFVFKKLVVLNIDDRTEEGYGEKIEKMVRRELEGMSRFDILPPETVRVRYPLLPQSLAKISKKFQADGFIAGGVAFSNKKLNISLEILDEKGETFALELLAVKERASQADLEKSVQEFVVKLIHRIPYKAVVTRVENGLVTFDAGRIRGVEIGAKASLFEIAGVKRHPFTNEVISFNREDLGQILVTKVEALSATGKIISIKKGAKIDVGQKVDFIPSEKVIRESLAEKKKPTAEQPEPAPRETEKNRKTKTSPKRPRGSLAIGTGFILNDYKFSSNNLNFKRHTSPVPMVAVTGEYWFLLPLGVDVSYATAWMQFDQTGSIPQTDATASWFAAHLKYRYFFSNDLLSPEIVGSVGYRVYDFEVDPSDSNFFNNIKYKGIDLTLAASYPITSRIKGVLNIGYQPSLAVDENPVTSGTDPKAYAYTIGLTGYYKITGALMLSLGYSYQDYQTKFSGTGTRNQPAGTTNSKISDRYQGANLSLIYEF